MIGKNSSSHGVSWILEDPVVLLLKVEPETRARPLGGARKIVGASETSDTI